MSRPYISVTSKPPKTEYYPIVTICGSMSFYDEMLRQAIRLTEKGCIVLIPFVNKDGLGKYKADRLDKLHIRKIALSDSVLVVNVDGYIGESTRKEITYAEAHHIPVTYLVEPKEESEQ
jgi:hypothetical protein